jgi:hypothetical protein
MKKELVTKWESGTRLSDIPLSSNIPPTNIID